MRIELWPSERGKRADQAFFAFDIEPDTLDTLIEYPRIITTRFGTSSSGGMLGSGVQRLKILSPIMLYTISHSGRRKNPDLGKFADVLRDGQELDWEIRIDLNQNTEEEKDEGFEEYLGCEEYLVFPEEL